MEYYHEISESQCQGPVNRDRSFQNAVFELINAITVLLISIWMKLD